MTPAQQRRLDTARQEGGTLTHRRLGNGSLLITHTYGGTKHHAVLSGDGEYVDTIESRLFTAYLDLSPMAEGWVMLSALRKAVKAKRPAVDAALVALFRAGSVYLVPESNRKALREEHHKAAIRVGSDVKHLVGFAPDFDPVN